MGSSYKRKKKGLRWTISLIFIQKNHLVQLLAVAKEERLYFK